MNKLLNLFTIIFILTTESTKTSQAKSGGVLSGSGGKTGRDVGISCAYCHIFTGMYGGGGGGGPAAQYDEGATLVRCYKEKHTGSFNQRWTKLCNEKMKEQQKCAACGSFWCEAGSDNGLEDFKKCCAYFGVDHQSTDKSKVSGCEEWKVPDTLMP